MITAPNPEVQAMFDEARKVLDKCDMDTDLIILGGVLMKLHGALENHIRHILLAGQTLSSNQRHEINGSPGYKRAGWLPLVKLLQNDFGLPRSERKYMLDYNDIRNDIAHGRAIQPEQLTLTHLQEYATFVEDCLHRNWTPIPKKRLSILNVSTVNPRKPASLTHRRPAPIPTDHPQPQVRKAPSPQPRHNHSKIPTGTQWVVKNLTALWYAVLTAFVMQIVAGIGLFILEACHLIPKGSTSGLTQLIGGVAGAACFFERQARGLVSDSTEWSIVSLMGIGMVGIPALVLGWIGRALFPTDNAFLAFLGYLIVGAIAGLAIGIAQYRVLRPSYPHIEAWIPANILDWSICLGFAPLLRLLRPEVETSFVALFVLPLMGFILGKAVTGYQVRQLRMG